MIASNVAAVLLAFVSGSAAYATCDPVNYPYRGQTVAPIPLQQSQQSFQGAPFSVSGSIEIVDGCTFRLANYQLTGITAAQRPVFFGGFPGQAEGYSLTDDTLVEVTTGTARTQTFTFTRRAGASMSFTEFSEFRLFHPGTNTLLARATIPNSPVRPNGGASSVAPPLPGPATSANRATSATTAASRTASASAAPSGDSKTSGATASLRSDPFVILVATCLALAIAVRAL